METLILSLLLIGAGVIIFIQHKNILELKKSSAKNLNRRGVLKQTWTRTITDRITQKQTESDSDVIIEIEELERLSGGLSRIKIIKISGGLDQKQRHDIKDKTAEIINTKDIFFTDEIEITDKPFNV